MEWKMRWWLIQKVPITRKLRAKLKNWGRRPSTRLGNSVLSCSSDAAGNLMFIISKVMAKTASLK
jgi:hypothetical protein